MQAFVNNAMLLFLVGTTTARWCHQLGHLIMPYQHCIYYYIQIVYCKMKDHNTQILHTHTTHTHNTRVHTHTHTHTTHMRAHKHTHYTHV